MKTFQNFVTGNVCEMEIPVKKGEAYGLWDNNNVINPFAILKTDDGWRMYVFDF